MDHLALKDDQPLVIVKDHQHRLQSLPEYRRLASFYHLTLPFSIGEAAITIA